MVRLEMEFVEDNKYKVVVTKSIYEKEAVLNTTYKYSNKAYFKIDSDELNFYIIIKPKVSMDELIAQKFVDEFCNELIDQQIRVDLNAKTGYIKKLIYDKAFSALKVN